MNFNTETSLSPDQLLTENVNEALDLKSEDLCQDCERISVTSSETSSIQEKSLSSNAVYVNNSTDVQIGDRTYLTIQHNVCPDSEVIKKILTEVVVSSKITPIVNVESSNGVIGNNLKILDGEYQNPSANKNDIKTITDGRVTEKPWSSKSFNLCGYTLAINVCALVVVILILIVTGFCFAVWKLTGDQYSTPTPAPYYRSTSETPNSIDPTTGTNDNSSGASIFIPSDPLPKDWYLMSRSDWNARNIMTDIPLLHHPIKRAIICHTAGVTCSSRVICSEKMRDLQAFSVGERGFDDVPYNFLVGGDGNAYEGLGWNLMGSHTKGYNNKSIAISFMGNFVYNHPTPQQLQAAKNIIKWGVDIGKLDPNYLLLAHNFTSKTSSPGRFVYGEIKNWPHFTEDLFLINS